MEQPRYCCNCGREIYGNASSVYIDGEDYPECDGCYQRRLIDEAVERDSEAYDEE